MSNSEKECQNGYSEFNEQSKTAFLLEISSGKTLDFQGKELNAELIKHVLTDPESSKNISNRGLIINNAVIKDKLDMEGLALDICIDFDDCTFEEEVNFNSAKIGSLTFARANLKGGLQLISAQIGSQLNCRGAFICQLKKSSFALLAQNAIIRGSVMFDGEEITNKMKCFEAFGEVNIDGIRIGGMLSCENGKFKNPLGVSLDATNAIIDGDVVFNKTSLSCGELLLQGAIIKGSLNFNEIILDNKNGRTINAKRIKVGGDVLFRKGFKSVGEVKFCGAQIGGQLKCRGAKFYEPTGSKTANTSDPRCAFIAQGLRLGGPLFMDDGFVADGEVNLFNARIEGNFDCTHGTFDNESGTALKLERARIDGDVYLCSPLINNKVDDSKKSNRFYAKGEVNLCGAHINGQLNCKNGFFNNEIKDSYGLKATGLTVNGPLFMSEGFEAIGGIDLLNANIQATIYCSGGKFISSKRNENSKLPAIHAERIKIAGDLILQYESFTKPLDCRNKLEVEGSINLKKAVIVKGLIYHEFCNRPISKMLLISARIGTMDVNQNVWGGIEKENLHDCIYNSIATELPMQHDEKKSWIKSTDKSKFIPQPYRQLAKVLDDMGYEKQAKDVRIEMNDQLRRCKQTKWKRKAWLWISGHLIDYGYSPLKVSIPALIIFLIGWVFYFLGYGNNLMYEVGNTNSRNGIAVNIEKNANQPRFSPFFYSLDVFLPVINFHQAEHWKPTPSIGKIKATPQDQRQWLYSYISDWGFWLTIWMYFQILAGWILATLLIGGLSGLIRER